MLQYYISAIIAFVIWGFFSLALKPIQAYASLDILFYRIIFSVALIISILLLFKRKTLKANLILFKALNVKRKKYFLIYNIGGGLLLATNWFSFIYAMNHISVRSTSLAYLICPILTTILAFILLGEKLNKMQWSATLVSIIACLILSIDNLWDLALSIFTGLTYALYLISQKKNKEFDKLVLLGFHIICAAIVLLPFFPNLSGVIPTSWDFYFYVILISVLFTIVPLFLNLFALKGINSSTVGMLLNINPIIAFILSIVYWGEPIDFTQLLSYILIFISVVLFNIPVKKKIDTLI